MTSWGNTRQRQRDPFAVDEGVALAELELAWADGGYHAFSAGGGTWCAVNAEGEALTGGVSGRRGVFDIDEDRVAAELEETWGCAGYHGFGLIDGRWSAISSAGTVLTGETPDELSRVIWAHWREMQ
jgi:hypothetical protein